MTTPRFTRLAQGLPASVPFVGPEAQERKMGHAFIARLGANESVFGPSPNAIAAMEKAARDVWMYGDPENHNLRHALAAHHGVAPENICIGEGIDGLLGYLTRLTVTEGDTVVTSDGAYPTFNFHVAGFGGVLHKAPYRDDHEDPEALLELAHRHRPRLIYLANPDNPMGSHHPAARIEAMLDQLPDGTLLILDEAYIDLAPEGTAPRIAPGDPRVIRFRTFSKGYGMAGLRVGYGIGAPDLIRNFDKVRNHFGMGRIAQAGALAALADQEWLHAVRQNITAARESFGAVARQNGLTPLPSATNFLTMDCGADGDFARSVLAALADEGVFVRMPFVAPQDRCIRVSLGDAPALEAFGRALPIALARAGQAG
ncbi:MAG: pyridoxal phosphate-dependent aminotransferase [Pseudorhodobacter sp.]